MGPIPRSGVDSVGRRLTPGSTSIGSWMGPIPVSLRGRRSAFDRVRNFRGSMLQGLVREDETLDGGTIRDGLVAVVPFWEETKR